jgi:hypothetical protein
MDGKIRIKFDNNVETSSGLSFLKGGKTLILEQSGIVNATNIFLKIYVSPYTLF